MFALRVLQYSFTLRSFNVSIGLDEASCPRSRGASPGMKSALSALALGAAPIPGIEMIVQERLLSLWGGWEGLYFYRAYYPILAG